jgi:hypothetical protein
MHNSSMHIRHDMCKYSAAALDIAPSKHSNFRRIFINMQCRKGGKNDTK